MQCIDGTFKATLVNVTCDTHLGEYMKYEIEYYLRDIHYFENNGTIFCEFYTKGGDFYKFNIDFFNTSYFKHIITNCFGPNVFTEKDIINAKIYALKEMFICIKQIVETHKEITAAYCYSQFEPRSSLTYEEYIHNVACKIILTSGYYKDALRDLKFNKLEFINKRREFTPHLLEN